MKLGPVRIMQNKDYEKLRNEIEQKDKSCQIRAVMLARMTEENMVLKAMLRK
jgi:hypothetical protein